jgi:RNA polymerase sigma-70 factor (ECF subfamily)
MIAKGVAVSERGTEGNRIQEDLYKEVAPGLWRAIYVYAGGRRDVADDAVAEAFTRSLESTRPIREPKAWLYRVAFRAAAAELRERSAQLPEGIDGYDSIAQREEVRPILDALRQLSPNQRAAIVMHYRLDLPVRDIARTLGITSATVKVHLHRGRNRLRELVKEPEDV